MKKNRFYWKKCKVGGDVYSKENMDIFRMEAFFFNVTLNILSLFWKGGEAFPYPVVCGTYYLLCSGITPGVAWQTLCGARERTGISHIQGSIKSLYSCIVSLTEPPKETCTSVFGCHNLSLIFLEFSITVPIPPPKYQYITFYINFSPGIFLTWLLLSNFLAWFWQHDKSITEWQNSAPYPIHIQSSFTEELRYNLSAWVLVAGWIVCELICAPFILNAFSFTFMKCLRVCSYWTLSPDEIIKLWG